jgi:hypothetical protein
MKAVFRKWNADTGDPWLVMEDQGQIIGLNVEEARTLALEIVARTWHQDIAREFLEKARAASK